MPNYDNFLIFNLITLVYDSIAYLKYIQYIFLAGVCV